MMEKIIYLGNIDQVVDELDLDNTQIKELLNNEQIIINDKYWLFTTPEKLEVLEENYPSINAENSGVTEWAVYAATDYWVNSMEETEFNYLVNNKDFVSSITSLVENLSIEEVVKLDIYKLAENTVKGLIITKLSEHIEKLTSEMKI